MCPEEAADSLSFLTVHVVPVIFKPYKFEEGQNVCLFLAGKALPHTKAIVTLHHEIQFDIQT